MTFPKPSVREKRASRPIARKGIDRAPKCECGHIKSVHTESGGCLGSRGMMDEDVCLCLAYRPGRSSPLKRGTGKPARAKRKLMPKCKHCAHPYSKHAMYTCKRCVACPGYEPAIGIRQKRRTPAAALKLRCDELWSKLVKAREWLTVKGCEIQRFYPHTCGGERQAMHGIPRTFAATRLLLINGFDGCRDIHKFFTDRPELWSSVLLDAWGEPTFRELWSKARAMQPVDMAATYAGLKAEAAARGIS